MKLVFTGSYNDSNVHQRLMDELEANKIKFKNEDENFHKISFRIPKDSLVDFQNDLSCRILGNQYSGSFTVED